MLLPLVLYLPLSLSKSWKHELLNHLILSMVLRGASASKNLFHPSSLSHHLVPLCWLEAWKSPALSAYHFKKFRREGRLNTEQPWMRWSIRFEQLKPSLPAFNLKVAWDRLRVWDWDHLRVWESAAAAGKPVLGAWSADWESFQHFAKIPIK